MKRIISICIAVISLLLLVSCGSTDSTAPDGMKQISTDASRFVMYVPEDWQTDLQTAAVSAHVSDTDLSNVSVISWALTNEVNDIDAWWEYSMSENEAAAALTDISEASVENSTLGEVFAKKYTYTAKLGGTEYKYMQIAAAKDGYIYVLTYTASPESFDTNLEDVLNIAKELKYR